MTKYYAYTRDMGETTKLYMVESTVEFAESDEFDPKDVLFAGVCIEAENEYEACAAFENPFGDSEVFWINEPAATASKRLDATPTDVLTIHMAATQIGLRLQSVNSLMSIIAEATYRIAGSPSDKSPETVYEHLKKNVLDRLINDCKFEPEL